MTTAPAQAADAGWQANLYLQFAPRGPRTALVRRRHEGPLMVQSAFYPEGEVCHVYLLHPPGGVVGGDTLSLTVDVQSGAHALLTTPAATKFYRSARDQARVVQSLSVADDAVLEWLPQESLVFSGALAHASTLVALQPRSRFIGWEAHCLGRPASSEMFESGSFRQDFEVYMGDSPVLIDRTLFQAGSPLMQADWGLSGDASLATVIASPCDEYLLAAARNAVNGLPVGRAACTNVDELLVCRVLAPHMRAVKAAVFGIWNAIRPHLLGRNSCAPRIWST